MKCTRCGGDHRPKDCQHTIVIAPDMPAQRLVRRLQRERIAGLLLDDITAVAITEALADEIHQATVDGTVGR
jgi:hypothetical protein